MRDKRTREFIKEVKDGQGEGVSNKVSGRE